MKKLIFILIFAACVFGVYGQSKNEDILKLLKSAGTDKLADQTMDLLIPQFKRLFPAIPIAFWDKFKEKTDYDDMLKAYIPLYDKYYTHDEIKQLITFYETPLGQKVVEVTPVLTQESMAIGQAWGERLGQEIVNELIKEGYLN